MYIGSLLNKLLEMLSWLSVVMVTELLVEHLTIIKFQLLIEWQPLIECQLFISASFLLSVSLD